MSPTLAYLPPLKSEIYRVHHSDLVLLRRPPQKWPTPKQRFRPCKMRWSKIYLNTFGTATFRLPGSATETWLWPTLRLHTRHVTSLTLRSLETSFRCSLPDNDTDMWDVVKAVADGALELIVRKPSSKTAAHWSKQRACMLFEVSLYSVWINCRPKNWIAPKSSLPPLVRRIYKMQKFRHGQPRCSPKCWDLYVIGNTLPTIPTKW